MTFEKTLNYLYEKLPMFSRQGKEAFKKDLTNIIALCKALGNPQDQFKSIHVAGTNGKGSVSHMLASVLQEGGYKIGLYTSPHLKNFTERIRINGEQVPENWVTKFIVMNMDLIERIKPSFFEITVAMSFAYFAEQNVDLAIVETGLGGRLDSTNIITPELSIITNIGYDHMDMLGHTLPLIAEEKAGIIKPNVPVIISETQKETEQVFFTKAHSVKAPIVFADRIYSKVSSNGETVLINQSNMLITKLDLDLQGGYQVNNARAVLLATDMLAQKGYVLTKEQVQIGLSSVKKNTGLRGRFEIIQTEPLLIFDVAHNREGVQQSLEVLKKHDYNTLHIIYGCVNDKDVSTVLPLFPRDAKYYFTQANVPRALDVQILRDQAKELEILGETFSTPTRALTLAKRQADAMDCILVIGSFFILEELI